MKSRNLPNTFENDCSFRIVCSSAIIRGFPGSVEEALFSGNYTGAPNENIVQNHLNIALLNVF